MMPAPPLHRLGITVLLTFFTFGAGNVIAEILPKKSAAILSPTLGFDARGSVGRGGNVTLRISAVPCYGSLVAFEIVKGPEHGTITSPRNDSDHSASVVYSNDPGDDAVADGFSFRCKAPGRAKSATCRVFISIVPPESRLVFDPEELDFGEVPAGESKTIDLRIENRGTAASGRLVPPAGFIFASEGEYFLEEGGGTNLAVEFRPSEEKNYSGSPGMVPPVLSDRTFFRGRGISRYTLEKDAGGSWYICNRSRQSIRISLALNPATADLSFPKTLSVNPGDRVLIPFQEKYSFAPSMVAQSRKSGSIGLSLSDGVTTTGLDLIPKGWGTSVDIIADSPQSSGGVPVGTSLPVKFRILNRSPANRDVRWFASSAHGGGSKNVNRIRIPAGGISEVFFEWRPDLPGDALLDVSVSDEVREQHLFWHAGILECKEAEKSPPMEIPSNRSTAALSKDDSKSVPPPIPPLQGISHAIFLSWTGHPGVKLVFSPVSDHDVARLNAEEERMIVARGLTRGGGIPAVTGMPLLKEDLQLIDSVDVASDQKETVMTLNGGFSPGWHMIRVSGISGSGKPLGVVRIPILVPPMKPWHVIFRLPLGIAAILCLILIYRKLRSMGY